MQLCFMSVALTAALSCPVAAQDSDLEKALDDSLAGRVRELATTFQELEASGLLVNRTIVVLPPLRPGDANARRAEDQVTRATGASELVADYLGRKLTRLLPEARIEYGAGLPQRFHGSGLSLGDYNSTAAGVALAAPMRVGMVIAGTLEQRASGRQPNFVVELRAQRGNESGVADWSPGRIEITKSGRMGYRPMDVAHTRRSQVPFAADPRVGEFDPSPDEIMALLEGQLEATLTEVASDFADFVVEEAAAGRIAPFNDEAVAVLPALGLRGDSPGALGESFTYALVDALEGYGPEDLIGLLEDEARRVETFDLTLGDWMSFGLSPSSYASLGVSHEVRTRLSARRLRVRGRSPGGELVLTMTISDPSGRKTSRTTRFQVGQSASVVKEWLSMQPEFVVDPSPIDAERVLRDALRTLMPAAVARADVDFQTQTLRLLPLETPATGSVLEAFGVVRSQLARARDDVARRADESDVTEAEALGSGEFPVTIDVLGSQTFEHWQQARRTLMHVCWANLALSETFQLGKRLQADYAVEISRAVGPRMLQSIPESLNALDLEQNQVRSREVGAADSVDLFLQNDPNFILSARWLDQSSRSCLIAQVHDFADPSRIVHLERVEFGREKTDAIRKLVGTAESFAGPKKLKTLLGLESNDATSTKITGRALVPAERDLLDAVELHVVYQGEPGREFANAISEELSVFPFDLARPRTGEAKGGWSRLDPKMNTRLEIRWSGGSTETAGKAAAEALHALLTSKDNQAWLSSNVRYTAQRFGAAVSAATGPNALLGIQPGGSRPTVVVLVRAQ